jgi:hypothetical protein
VWPSGAVDHANALAGSDPNSPSLESGPHISHERHKLGVCKTSEGALLRPDLDHVTHRCQYTGRYDPHSNQVNPMEQAVVLTQRLLLNLAGLDVDDLVLLPPVVAYDHVQL